MKQIMNEGRVLGLSSFELYLRQLMSRDPDATPLSESQWLAASLGTNNSMIMKVVAGTTAGYHDYILPEGSDLCSCTHLLGTVFEGECEFNGVWATRVNDYGRLISNAGERHPVTPGEPVNVPTKVNTAPSEEFITQCREYMKITCGMMFQPGEWIDNVYQVELQNESYVNITTEDDIDLLADVSDSNTRMTLDADLSKRGFVRLLFDEAVENDFYIFLHGFSYKTIMAGMSGFDRLVTTDNPENGDFLGPQSFPWAVPITFVYTNDMLGTIRYSVERMEALYEQVVHSTDYYEEIARELNTRYNQLTQLYEDLNQGFAETVDRVDEMQETVNTYDSRINSVDAHITSVETSTDIRLDDAETRLNNIDDSLVANDRRVTNLQGQVDDLEIRFAAFGETFDTTLEEFSQRIGSLEDLTTEDKSSVVAAINEVTNNVGNLTQLTTTNKTQIVRAINEVNSKIPTT